MTIIIQRLVVAIVLRILRPGKAKDKWDCVSKPRLWKKHELNYSSSYHRFFIGIQFSDPQMTVLALDGQISLDSAANLQKIM